MKFLVPNRLGPTVRNSNVEGSVQFRRTNICPLYEITLGRLVVALDEFTSFLAAHREAGIYGERVGVGDGLSGNYLARSCVLTHPDVKGYFTPINCFETLLAVVDAATINLEICCALPTN